MVDVLVIHGISEEFGASASATRVVEHGRIIKSVVHLTGSVLILNLGNTHHSSEISLIAASISH